MLRADKRHPKAIGNNVMLFQGQLMQPLKFVTWGGMFEISLPTFVSVSTNSQLVAPPKHIFVVFLYFRLFGRPIRCLTVCLK